MADYDLHITARSPLLFSVHKPGGIFQESLPYVPGAVIRGALAKLWLASTGNNNHAHLTPVPDCQFCGAFVAATGAIFTNAYPVQTQTETPFVLPATAVACKHHENPLFDTLIERLCWERLAPPGLIYDPSCPICAERTESRSGIYVQHAQHWRARRVEQRLLTRVAINRRRNVAEDGMLYSPFVIDEVNSVDLDNETAPHHRAPTQFRGQVRRLSSDLAATLEQINHIGGASSRSLGHVTVTATDSKPISPTVTERLQQFSDCLQTTWGEFSRLPGSNMGSQPVDLYFSFTLQSDAILVNPHGLPSMVYTAEMLQQQTGLSTALIASYASYGYAGGWNAAWGLPKPTELMTRLGSTYLYHTQAPEAAVIQALTQLEDEGIGQRRSEGHGQVRAVHEFHTIRRKTYVADSGNPAN